MPRPFARTPRRPQPSQIQPLPPLPSPAPEPDDEGGGFHGWLASSVELKVGLLVQYLRIDPMDADWREVFAG